jgi:Flp pilus assembly protein TadD/YHS domain-containing protein
MVREAAGLQAKALLAAAVTQSPRKPAIPAPRPQAKPPTLATPAPHAAARADVLASARQLEQMGRLPEAQRAYQAAMMRYPQHVECLHRLGVVCTRLNDFEAARAHFDRALLISPDQAQIQIDYGYSRYLAGDYRQSEKLLRRSLELSPNDLRATNNLGVLLGVTGRFDESLALFQKANPPAKAWTNLAYVYQLRREPDQALICYQRARHIDGNILIPEELLVATSPTERLVTEADLPPAPGMPKGLQQPSQTALAGDFRPNAPRTTPKWAQEESPRAAEPQPSDVVPAIGNSDAESTFEPPLVAAGESSPASSADEDPFQLPLQASPQTAAAEPGTTAPALDEEPALDADASSAHQPVRFEAPAAQFAADDSLDATEMAWLATERAKLVKRAHFEGMKGFCLVTLCEERRLEEAQDEFVAEFRDQKFTFCSAEAVERFQAEPEKYLPAAGGLDIVAVRTGEEVASGSLDFAVWYRNRLYLFSSQKHKDDFSADPHKFVKE